MIIKGIIICVYKITSPKGRVYIGSSTNVRDRIKHYKCAACKNQKRLYFSLKKYGWEAHKFEILEECTVENMWARETYYGRKYNVLGKMGLNLALPKDGDVYKCTAESTRKKQSLARMGKSPANKGIPMSDEQKKLMSSILKGRISPNKDKPMSEEQKVKLSISHKGQVSPRKGVKITEREKEAMSLRMQGTRMHKKQVLDTKTGILYECAIDAAKIASIKPGTFVNMLNPNHQHTNKTSFIYVDVNANKKSKSSGFNNNNRGKIVLNTETGIFYDSGKSAYLAHPNIHKKCVYTHFSDMLNNIRKKNTTPFIYI